MKKILFLSLIMTAALSSCNFDFSNFIKPVNPNEQNTENNEDQKEEQGEEEEEEEEKNPLDGKEFKNKTHYIEFNNTQEDKSLYFARNGYKNVDDMFGSYWVKNNVSNENVNGTLCAGLTLKDTQYKKQLTSTGAEIMVGKGFFYGYYGTRMKTFSRKGTVQSFFMYNGPGLTEGAIWDEIDIEFLGKDTTKVQFNYFKNGVGGHEYIYDLGFDSKDDFHDYGFLWEQNTITWFVDFKPVYMVEAALTQWGFPMLNVWGGNPNNEKAIEWLDKYETEEEISYTTYYDYIIANSL